MLSPDKQFRKIWPFFNLVPRVFSVFKMAVNREDPGNEVGPFMCTQGRNCGEMYSRHLFLYGGFNTAEGGMIPKVSASKQNEANEEYKQGKNILLSV